MDAEKIFDLLKQYFDLLIKFLAQVLGADFSELEAEIADATLPAQE